MAEAAIGSPADRALTRADAVTRLAESILIRRAGADRDLGPYTVDTAFKLAEEFISRQEVMFAAAWKLPLTKEQA